jgi:hypothetical protein
MINLLESFVEGVKDSNTEELQFMLNYVKYAYNIIRIKFFSSTNIFCTRIRLFSYSRIHFDF